MSETQTGTRHSADLDDPEIVAASEVYGEALIDAAANTSGKTEGDETGGVDGILTEFHEFRTEVLDPNPAFRDLLTSPFLNEEDKLGVIDRVVAPNASPTFTNFLKALVRHDRLTPGFLPLVHDAAVRLHGERSGRKAVRVTSAHPLSDENLDRIRERLRSSFGFEPVLETEVDPELIGGLVLQVGDTVYDSSLRTRLKQLRVRLNENTTHVIQRERDRFGHPEGN